MTSFCCDQCQTYFERVRNISMWMPQSDHLYKVTSENKSLTYGCIDISLEAPATLSHILSTSDSSHLYQVQVFWQFTDVR